MRNTCSHSGCKRRRQPCPCRSWLLLFLRWNQVCGSLVCCPFRCGACVRSYGGSSLGCGGGTKSSRLVQSLAAHAKARARHHVLRVGAQCLLRPFGSIALQEENRNAAHRAFGSACACVHACVCVSGRHARDGPRLARRAWAVAPRSFGPTVAWRWRVACARRGRSVGRITAWAALLRAPCFPPRATRRRTLGRRVPAVRRLNEGPGIESAARVLPCPCDAGQAEVSAAFAAVWRRLRAWLAGTRGGARPRRCRSSPCGQPFCQVGEGIPS